MSKETTITIKLEDCPGHLMMQQTDIDHDISWMMCEFCRLPAKDPGIEKAGADDLPEVRTYEKEEVNIIVEAIERRESVIVENDTEGLSRIAEMDQELRDLYHEILLSDRDPNEDIAKAMLEDEINKIGGNK